MQWSVKEKRKTPRLIHVSVILYRVGAKRLCTLENGVIHSISPDWKKFVSAVHFVCVECQSHSGYSAVLEHGSQLEPASPYDPASPAEVRVIALYSIRHRGPV